MYNPQNLWSPMPGHDSHPSSITQSSVLHCEMHCECMWTLQSSHPSSKFTFHPHHAYTNQASWCTHQQHGSPPQEKSSCNPGSRLRTAQVGNCHKYPKSCPEVGEAGSRGPRRLRVSLRTKKSHQTHRAQCRGPFTWLVKPIQSS